MYRVMNICLLQLLTHKFSSLPRRAESFHRRNNFSLPGLNDSFMYSYAYEFEYRCVREREVQEIQENTVQTQVKSLFCYQLYLI